jgi:uncharacterized protein YbjQ (UPF0145 family)
MLLVTTHQVEGKKLETLGLVSGSVVQSKHIGRDFMAGLKTIVGGELSGYTEMMNEARATATARLKAEAKALGADAVVGLLYSSSAIMDGAAEILAYGTAVRFV